jgi:MFS family permease
MVDWFGHRTFLLIVSALSLTLAHLLIYSAALGAILPLLMIGLAYSIFGSVIWPCVPVVVEESLHGTAYGTMAAFQNTGQFIMPLVLQYIFRIEHHLFRPCELFLAFTAFSAMVCGFILYHMDRKYFDGILSKPSVIVRS